MKNTNSNSDKELTVKEFISLLIYWLIVFICGYAIINLIIEFLQESGVLIIFLFIVGFPIAMLTDEFRESFDFIPGCIVKILRIVGIAEFVGLVGLIIWFVFVY